MLGANRLEEVQDGKTGARIADGSTNRIRTGSVLIWDTANQKSIRKKAAGTEKFDGISLEETVEDNISIAVYESGVIWLPVADIGGGADPQKGDVMYVDGSDDLYSDTTRDSGANTTAYGRITAIRDTTAKIEFDVKKSYA